MGERSPIEDLVWRPWAEKGFHASLELFRQFSNVIPLGIPYTQLYCLNQSQVFKIWMFIILLKLTKMGASVSSWGTSLSVLGQYVGLQRNLGKLYTSITRPASQLIEWLVQSLTAPLLAPSYQVFLLEQIIWKYSVTSCTFSHCNHSVQLCQLLVNFIIVRSLKEFPTKLKNVKCREKYPRGIATFGHGRTR